LCETHDTAIDLIDVFESDDVEEADDIFEYHPHFSNHSGHAPAWEHPLQTMPKHRLSWQSDRRAA